MPASVRLYAVFTSNGLFGSTGTYSFHHPDQKLLTNTDILSEISTRCQGVEFLGSTEIESPEYTMANLRARRHTLDGVLYFGALPSQLLDLDLPVIAVHPLWSQWQEPFNAYTGKRVLTATLPVIPDSSPKKFADRLDQIAAKIRLLQTVVRLQDLRILCVTDRPVLGEYEPTVHQTSEEGRPAYEETYLSNLAALGPGIIVRPQQEMVSKLTAISDADTDDIAKRWMSEAEDMKGTNESEIRKSAKLYLALKGMMQEYGATAVTTEGYGVFMNYPDGPIPSQGLPSSQFCTDGVVATSETLVDSLVTQQLGLWLTGFAGFNGDYIVDRENGKAYVGHCECPFNPWGDERHVPYIIRNLPQWPVDQQEKGGACVQVRLPHNEQVTVAKFSVHDRKLSLFTGQTVPGDKLFPGWDDILCRTKVAIDTDAEALLNNLDWTTFGNHRVVFFGDYKETFRNLAKLLDYEIVESDSKRE
ncbi:MAG: hypothetical protein K9N51_08130 [Candidatus Pacebacteria bacterium]|nr:hypothetical protein [Candidatus Paceibacterota bacterium]